ncbi:MAG: hypothetical protein O3A13_09795 [Proteobacteria bacterium]|nr:hypothetical protein [Pseudomonadota bacterium]MDA0993912.1 hypothetical protein [Pseudomonadota bacterium]
MTAMLFLEMLAATTQNAPLCNPHIYGQVADRVTNSPGAIWDAGTQ